VNTLIFSLLNLLPLPLLPFSYMGFFSDKNTESVLCSQRYKMEPRFGGEMWSNESQSQTSV